MSRAKRVLMVLGSYDQSAHEGIARYAGQHGWHLNVSILKDFQLPENWHGDGIITSLNFSRQLEEFIAQAKVPTVDLSIWREDIDLPRVVADNVEIGRLGAQHFIDLGYRNCAWFGLAINPVSRTRLNAYQELLSQSGIDCIRLDTVRPQDGVYMTERLLALPKPCAIYTKSDYDSAWIANLCFDADLKVPDDIAILGADDNLLICESQSVKLSSVRYDLAKIGYEGSKMLDGIMSGNPCSERMIQIAPSGITVRQSTDAIAVTDPFIREVLLYLRTNFRKSLGTKDLAEHFQVSRRHLETHFRESMRRSIREHLIGLRLKEAKSLLQFSKEPIETIAALTGFCHAPHFSGTFKKHFNQSPTQFRNQSQ